MAGADASDSRPRPEEAPGTDRDDGRNVRRAEGEHVDGGGGDTELGGDDRLEAVADHRDVVHSDAPASCEGHEDQVEASLEGRVDGGRRREVSGRRREGRHARGRLR